jgi:AbrB family looped-hinge helix DNA binding protein
MTEVKVTRHGQITLSKEVREALGIREGDEVIINVAEDKALISKKDRSVWDKLGDFLPQNFEAVLKQIRTDSKLRFRELGITE